MFLSFNVLSLNVHFHELPAGRDLCADGVVGNRVEELLLAQAGGNEA